MKAETIIRLAMGLFIISFLVSCSALPPQQTQGQSSGHFEPSEKYSRAELAQMLAPIALYPDALLSQILMASTYPLEVIAADRWVRGNPGVKGETLDSALLDKSWDPSIKAICHFPSILALMSEQISETIKLGNAFLAQEDEVMDMVQELRAKANAQGNLATASKQKVIIENGTIIIKPVDPRVIYVPYYDPFYAYGPWWYPAYPPYYWGPPGVSIGVGISYWPGFYFGFAFGTWSYFDWHRNYIYIDVYKCPRYVRPHRWRSKSGRWHHAPRHRRSVSYRDKPTARKYGQYPRHYRDFRRGTRNFSEHRDGGLDRRGSDRISIDRNKHEQHRIDRERQARELVEREKRVQKHVERGRQARLSIERERQMRRHAGQEMQARKRDERKRQMQKPVGQKMQVRKRVEHERRVQKRVEQGRQARVRIERERQVQKHAGQETQARKRVDREQKQRSRENAFNLGDNGRKGRQANERGWVNRQGRGNDFRGRGPSGRYDRRDRYDRDRNRR